MKFGGDELLFEVGLLIKTPKNKTFPATFYWAQGGLSIGCWQKEILGNFIGLKNNFQSYEFIPIHFSDIEKEELAEAFESTLRSLPISDFEGEYWDENGGIRMGIESGIPFIEDIPIEDNAYYALCYYGGMLMDIMNDCASTEELERFENLSRIKKNVEYKNSILLKFSRYLIHKCYDDLILFPTKKKSRYSFQALGLFLMENGIKIPNDVKKVILERSHWKDEFLRFKDRKERAKRREELVDFITKILNHREGNYISFPYF